ncbi:MAG: SdpI family protein [Flavobacterium sp.]
MIATELIVFASLYIALGLIVPYIKTINNIIGYRTHRAMKNQCNWEFAQKYSGKCFLYLGIGTVIYSIIAYFLPEYTDRLSKFYYLPMIIALAFIIYKTEQGLNPD